MATKKRPLDPAVIRVGDTIRITAGRHVKRVGYPKAVDDYVEDAKRLFHDRIREGMQAHLDERMARAGETRPCRLADTFLSHPTKLYRQLAYELAKRDGFGGKKRIVHYEDAPDLVGQTCEVYEVRRRITGDYFPGGTSYDWECSFTEYEPGGLGNWKVVVLYGVYASRESPSLDRVSNLAAASDIWIAKDDCVKVMSNGTPEA